MGTARNRVAGCEKRSLALALALAAAIIVVFLPGLENGFVWDDKPYVLENPRVAGGLTLENLRWALTSFTQGNWHPLTWVSHMLDVQFFGLKPRGHHAVSLLFHVANALLLFSLLRGLTGRLWRSFLVAALFALHPLRVESVAWIAERKDILAAFFGLLAAGAHLRYARRPGPLRYGAVLLLFALGLMAKPMLVTLPGVLLLLDFWPLGRLTPSAWRRPALEKLPLVALAAAASTVTFLAQVGAGYYMDFPLALRLSNAAVAYLRYLAKAALPIDLAAFYPYPMTGLPLRQTLGALLVLAAATLLALRARRCRPYLGVGWFWYLWTLVPVIGLVQVGQQAIADRYTYLPLIGVVIALVWAGAEIGQRRPALKIPLAAGAAAAILALSAATWIQVGYWKDAVSLYTHAIAAGPGNWMAHYNLGVVLEGMERPDAAIEHYREALRYRGDFTPALNNLGVILAERGDSAQAMTLYQAAIRAAPDDIASYNNLGVELTKLGRASEAEACYRAALRRNPYDLDLHLNLGWLMLAEKRLADAAAEFGAALRIDPGSAKATKGLRLVSDQLAP